jgi:sortase A
VKIAEALLWVVGIVLTLVFIGGLALSEYNRVNDIAEFKAQLASARAQTGPASAESVTDIPRNKAAALPGDGTSFVAQAPQPDQSFWSDARKAHYEESRVQEAGEVLALLEIPSLDLEVPLYDGASELHLNLGIARIDGTALPGEEGNLGIAGHRDGYFRVLQDIKFGDELVLTTMDGVLTYKVDELKIVDPSSVEVLNDRGRASITLVTCYPFYFVGHAPERFIVHATLQET